MNLAGRVLRRSGVLTFDPGVDNEDSEDLRLRWITQLHLQVGSVIDFGCWTGAALASTDADRRVGLDLPGPWIARAQQRLPQAEIIPVESFDTLPETLAGAFELALFLDTLEHIPRRTQVGVLASIYASLRDGGTLILTTPAAGPAAVLDPAWLLMGHRHYRAATLRRMLGSTGFRDIRICYSGNLFTAVDVLSMYAKKHLLHRHHHTTPKTLARLDTGLYERSRVDAAAVWAICRR